MEIKYCPFTQIEKNGRPYAVLFPMGAPWDEAIEVMQEIVEGLKVLKQQALEAEEKRKLDAEMANQVASADSDN